MAKENVNLGTLLLESRILFIGSEVNPEMANTIVSALLYLDMYSGRYPFSVPVIPVHF